MNELYYQSVLKNKYDENFDIVNGLGILYGETLVELGKLSPYNFVANTKYLNNSFFVHLSNNFIEAIESIDTKAKIKIFQHTFSKEQINKVLQNIENIGELNSNNFFVSMGYYLIKFCWDLIKIDGVSIFLTLEFLAYQFFYHHNPNINKNIGFAMYTLKQTLIKILLNL